MPGTQADVDPVALCYQWLRDHPDTPTVLGGPDHVSGIAEDPWPHVVLDDGLNGDLRDGWSQEHEVTVEVLGHPDGTPGKAALRALAMRVLDLLRAMPEAPVTDPAAPVVSRVRPSGVFAYTPQANGQPRYVLGVYVTARPPLS